MSSSVLRNSIEVECPECGHLQKEPSMVVSTQCRSCFYNYQILNGKSVKKPRHSTILVSSPKQSSSTDPVIASKHFSLVGCISKVSEFFKSYLVKLSNKKSAKKKTQLQCFECKHTFSVLSEAQSSQCPKCGFYINLQNYQIKDHWNRHVQTWGDVTLTKTGVISGATIKCRNFNVFGKFSGSVECAGDFVIHSNSKVFGAVNCKKLLVQRNAQVEFLNKVTAGSVIIKGYVRGKISSSGPIVIEKKAHLHGVVRASSLIVKAGAKHVGSIEMITPEETE